MPNLNFQIDWLDAEGVKGAELAATWAALRIEADDSVVTRVHDIRAQTVRDFVFVPIYPLAEWLATNWWFLAHEFENPVKAADPAFRHRHALGQNREGYAFPNLEAVPLGARVRLAWSRAQSPWSKVEFLNQGAVLLGAQEFRERCADLVDRVVRRLAALDFDDTLLQKEWSAIQAADEEESQFCAAAAGLGLDPYSMDESRRMSLLRLAERFQGPLLEEAVTAIDPQSIDASGDSIADAMQAAKSNGLRLRCLESMRQSVREREISPTHSSWEAGYNLARQVRQHLGLGADPLNTMENLGNALGESSELIHQATQPVAFPAAPLVDGVVTQDDDEAPAFALRSSHREDNRRFHFCRALAETLASPNTDSLLTRAHSDRQQRNRAFAAEFLAPSSALREQVRGTIVDGDELDELASRFGVSTRVVEHQVVNHRIAEIQANT